MTEKIIVKHYEDEDVLVGDIDFTGIGTGTGTVTNVSVTTANGVSGSVATSTTTPAITLTLGDITPNSVTVMPLSDRQAGTFRRNNGAQTSHIIDIQTEINGALGNIDKDGNITMTNLTGTNTGDNASNTSSIPRTVAVDAIFTTGVQARTLSTLAFDNGTQIFTIAPTGASFDIYLSSVKYAKTACTVDLNTVGLVTNTMYYIYFDATATLKGSVSPWNIQSNICLVATIYWNGTTGALQEERHGSIRNLAWHEWAHHTIGTGYQSGLAATGVAGAIAIGTGVIDDEDIEITITPQTTATLWYRNAAATAMTFNDVATGNTANIVGGALKYDNTGTLTSVTDTYYVRNLVYATNDVARPIYVVTGQAEYTNVNDARAVSTIVFPNIASNEMRLISRSIWRNVGGTPTFIETTDYRNSVTTIGGIPEVTPIFLNDLEDVLTPSPQVDDVLSYNGNVWTTKPGTSISGSAGTIFYVSTPLLNTRTAPTGLSQDGTAGNGIQTGTLATIPVVTVEQSLAGINNGDTRMFSAWENSVLGRTQIDAGNWQFTTYASVSSTANTPQLIRSIYQIVPGTGTLTMTGAGANSRTATITQGQYTGTYFVAGATNTTASYIQATSGTNKGMYQITAMSDGAFKIATVTTMTGYANETGVTYNIWNLLFTISIPLTSTSIIKYDTVSTQGLFTVATTDKIGSAMFITSTANARTVTVTYNGTSRQTNFLAPLKTLHNQLSGVQGLVGNEAYHMNLVNATLLTTPSTSGNVMTSNGSIWTSAPASGFAWGASITSTSGTGVTITVANSSNASTLGQSIVIGSTQTQNLIGLDINTGTANVNETGQNITALNGYGLTICKFAGATQLIRDTVGVQIGTLCNTSSTKSMKMILLDAQLNDSSGLNSGLWINNYNANYYDPVNNLDGRATGIYINQAGAGGTAMSIKGANNVNTQGYGLMNVWLTNTQNGASYLYVATLGTSSQAHNGFVVNGANASATANAFNANMQTNWTGNLFRGAVNSVERFVVTATGTIKKRVVTTTDLATAAIDVTITDVFELSAVANATTFTLTGAATNGQEIVIRIKDAGTAKGLTWTGFTIIGVTLPTTTVQSKRHYIKITYNLAATAWHVITVQVEA